jgi:hypothetical protein
MNGSSAALHPVRFAWACVYISFFFTHKRFTAENCEDTHVLRWLCAINGDEKRLARFYEPGDEDAACFRRCQSAGMKSRSRARQSSLVTEMSAQRLHVQTNTLDLVAQKCSLGVIF